MDFITAAKNSYYSKYDKERVYNLIQKLDDGISFVSDEFLCLFVDCISNEPCCYWEKDVFQQTYSRLSDVIGSASQQITVDEKAMELYIIGYKAYQEITQTLNDLPKSNKTPEMLNRIYVSVTEGCLTNLFKVILHILSQFSAKDYTAQKNLQPICEVLQSNGFSSLANDINISIRNAINHGGVLVRELGREIDYTYTAKVNGTNTSVVETISIYALDELVKNVYDTASGILLGITRCFSENMNCITIDRGKKTVTSFALLSMGLSIPDIRCKEINDVQSSKQINLDFHVENTDRLFLMQTAVELAIITYSYYDDYEQYMIFFSNERLQSSWIRFKNAEINDMIERVREPADVYIDVIKRKDCIIWNASTEEIDMQEVKYFKFPNYSNTDFKINTVEDASVDDRKRLKCHMFVGDITDKRKILEMINAAVDWIKMLKNPPSPTIPHKYGTMEADSVYMNVYRKDSRGDKALWLSNKNLVCLVDYNIDGVTTMKNGGLPPNLWNQYSHEKVGKMLISWREAKYAIVKNEKKIGRNAPCLCGSGKKHKKCCIT